MAAAILTSTTDDGESCVFCSSRYNRDRPSFCQCKHCSIPLCLDCIREHHDDILQSAAQLSHQYNELKELIQTKQNMIVDETTKTIGEVNHYFDTRISELCEAKRKTIEDLQTTKQDAQNYVGRVNLDLDSLAIEIQALAKEGIVQTTKMKRLSTEIKRIEEQLNTYQVMRSDNVVKTNPSFMIKFACPSVRTEASSSATIETSKNDARDTKETSSTVTTLDASHQLVTVQGQSINQPRRRSTQVANENANSHVSDDGNHIEVDRIETSYNVDRMASDGNNILYASYYNQEPDLIAYCLLTKIKGDADAYRDWKQSRIDDMIWWNSIKKFVCATTDAIYTVEYANRTFKIVCTVRGNWSYVRIAANNNLLFVWMNASRNEFNGIEVYSTEFQCVRTIDINRGAIKSFADKSTSFCITNEVMASVCMRTQNNREVFRVTFCDLAMNALHWHLLGECGKDIAIRTDGMNQFFITTGRGRFYILSSDGTTRTITLQNDGNCVAVLDDRRVAISNGHANIELVTY